MSEILAENIASDNEDKLFLSLSEGIIKALDTKGDEIWKTEVGGEIVASPRYNKGSLFVISRADSQQIENNEEVNNNLYSVSALDKDSGITIWKKDYRSEQTPIISIQKERLAIVLTGKIKLDGYASRLYILEEQTGNFILQKNYEFEIKQVLNADSKNNENIVMFTTPNTVGSFSILDGKITLSKTAAKTVQAGAVFDGGTLLSNAKGGMYLIDLKGNEHEFKIRFGAGISSIVEYRNSILITSLDNFIYSITADGKKLNWKRRFAGRIIEKPIINQGVILAYSQGENALYLLNHEDGKILNRITVADGKEITGSPILLDNFLFVMTNKGLEAFGKDGCKNLAAAKS